MTQANFIALCNEYHIDPSLALENDNLVDETHTHLTF